MAPFVLPALWLIALIAGLPVFSETVYSPSLPEIAHSLHTSETMAEYTLTIYLFAFSIGILLWGNLSDRYGRKPCLLIGFLIYIIGCISCYFSSSITALMIGRFIQAFGGSTGSVLGQTISRDAFHGPKLGKMYAAVSSSLAFSPAIGPTIGGFVAQNWGWQNIFLVLIFFAITVCFFIFFKLPETLHPSTKRNVSLFSVAKSLFTQRKVLGFGLLVAFCNGITFSYFAEGSFFLIKILGLTPSTYGMTFIALAISVLIGGITSNLLHNFLSPQCILQNGLKIALTATTFFSLLIIVHNWINTFSALTIIIFTIINQMIVRLGMSLITAPALSLALEDYKWCMGTASSLFGFFYYSITALITLGMGTLHNGTLLPMPLYFFTICVGMVLIEHFMIRPRFN